MQESRDDAIPFAEKRSDEGYKRAIIARLRQYVEEHQDDLEKFF